jgi:hypothetical protein
MRIRRSTRATTRLTVLLAGLALFASACQSATFTYTSVFVDNGQDEAEYGVAIADEVVLRTLAWRTTLGTAGSSSVDALTSSGITTQAVPGSTVAVPASHGEAAFANINPVDLAQLQNGQVPEVLGIVTLVFESDQVDEAAVDAVMATTAAELQSRLVAEFESVTPNTASSIAVVTQLNDALAETFFPPGGDRLEKITDDAFALAFPAGVASSNDYFFVSGHARAAVSSQLAAVFSGLGSSAFSSFQSWTGGTLDAGTENVSFDIFGGGGKWQLSLEITL